MGEETILRADVLVIGGGIAGAMAAIAAREKGADVLLVDKGYAGKSGASIHPDIGMAVFDEARGGDYETCLKAMAEAGGRISNREWCEAILKESKKNYEDFLSWGIEFPPDEEKFWMFFPPIPHVRLKHRKLAPGIRKHAAEVGTRILDRVEITDLLQRGGRAVGAYGFSLDSGERYIFYAKATVLAAGSNSFRNGGENCGITGDAHAMAYRIGARVVGKEFGSSTFPTMAKYASWSRTAHGMMNPAYPVFSDGAGRPLDAVHDSESVENEWGLKLELAVHEGRGPVYWDTTGASDADLEAVRQWRRDTHSPVEYEQADRYLDPVRRARFEMAGGYAVGFDSVGCSGVYVASLRGDTDIPGLYAAGDAGGTRHNGSYNMSPGLGSAPAAVTGKHAGYGACGYAERAEAAEADPESLRRVRDRIKRFEERDTGFAYQYVNQQLRQIMVPYYVSLIKERSRLEAALQLVRFLKDHMVPRMFARDPHELKMCLETENMVLNAEMMLRASLAREESRGVHYREDFPRRDDENWLAWSYVKDEDGQMTAGKIPVPAGMWEGY